jgi:DNA-binding MarR family transcriptional regulator
MRDERRLSDDEQELWDSFFVMRSRLDKALDLELAGDYGVSISELEVLVALLRVPDRRMRVKELASVLGWEKSRVSHQVTRMVRRGLVEREACPGDARATNIHLTSNGRRIIVKAMPGLVATIRKLFMTPLDEKQRNVLLDVSRVVTRAIDQSGLVE